jgi:hypothetical protein
MYLLLQIMRAWDSLVACPGGPELFVVLLLAANMKP